MPDSNLVRHTANQIENRSSKIENLWSPWSDSHRRIRVYETRPVATEAQGLTKCRIQNEECRMTLGWLLILQSAFYTLHSKVALSRGFAPRTSAFAERRAYLLTP